VVKRVDAVELRVVVAAVLAVAADAVLVAQHLLKLSTHLVTALACLHVLNPARRSSLEAGASARKRAGRSGKTSETPCGSSARETGNAGGARACIPNGKAKWFYPSNLSSFGTVQSTLGVGGCGRERFASATCQLQFAKASAATLLHQEKNDTADVQRGRVHISGFIDSVAT
jgi:hypothetical protein